MLKASAPIRGQVLQRLSHLVRSWRGVQLHVLLLACIVADQGCHLHAHVRGTCPSRRCEVTFIKSDVRI